MTDTVRFASWFASELQLRDWTAADFARAANIQPGVVSHWMWGKRRPNPESADLIADVLGVDLDFILNLLGHRPMSERVDQRDPRQRVIAMIKRLPTDDRLEDRLSGIEGTLRGWSRFDREQRRVKEPQS